MKMIMMILIMVLLSITVSAVKINQTIQFCGNESTNGCNTDSGNNFNLEGIVAADGTGLATGEGYQTVDNDDIGTWSNFSINGNTTATITGATLFVNYFTDDGGYDCGVDGPEFVQFRNDNEGTGWTDTTIEPVNTAPDTPVIETYDLFAQGIDIWAEIKDLDLKFDNCDRGGGDLMTFDFMFIEVEFSDTTWNDTDLITNTTDILLIGVGGTSIISTINITDTINISAVETQVISVGGVIDFYSSMNLTLTSPLGTEGLLYPSKGVNTADTDATTAMYYEGVTNAWINENSSGIWTLTMTAQSVGEYERTLNSFGLKIRGHNTTIPEPAAPADSCSCPVGDWVIDCSDNCSITENCDIGSNSLFINGAGTFEILANITVDLFASQNTCNVINIPLDSKELRVKG